MRLSGCGQHSAPCRSVRIESFLLLCQRFDRNVNESIMKIANHQARLPGHCGMDGMAREQIAENRIFRIRRAAPYEVAGIKIAHDNGNLSGLIPVFDPPAEEHSDVLELDISGSVPVLLPILKQVLTGTLGDDHHGVSAFQNASFESGEKSTFPLQLKRQFGN